MARKIVVLPTCDIHLLGIGGSSMQLTVRSFSPDRDVTKMTGALNTRYEGFDPTLVTVTQGLVTVQSPPRLGVTVGRVIFHDMYGNDHEVQVRVQVHDSINKLWFGNQHATIHKGQSNYVLTVYAIFSDGTVADVTAHPYLDFEPFPDGSIVTVNKEGRLTGIAKGETEVWVEHGISIDNMDTVTVKVKEALPTKRSILEPLHGTDNFNDRRNFLILAEGFSDKEEFKRLTDEIKERFTTKPWASPFNLMRESYNIWTAFEKSYEDGISVGPEVKRSSDSSSQIPAGTPLPPRKPTPASGYSVRELVKMVGLPDPSSPDNPEAARGVWSGTVTELDGTPFRGVRLEGAIFQAWLELRESHPLQVKDSRFGLIYGARLGDRDSEQASLTRSTLWYVPTSPHRVLGWDRRRLDSDLDPRKFIGTYLESLSYKNQPVGSRWLPGGPDEGLVGILVNDDVHGGRGYGEFEEKAGSYERFYIFAVSKGKNQAFVLKVLSQGIDHDPREARVKYVHLVDNFSHEFGHLILGDEYHADYRGESRLQPGDPSHQRAAEIITLRANLTHIEVIESATTPGRIDPARIKWGKWHRITMADALAAPASNVGPSGSDQIEVQLKTRQGKNWKALEGSVVQQVFLRNKDLNENRPHSTARLLGPLSIVSASTNGDTLVLSGGNVSGPDDFPEGSTLYLPHLPIFGSPTPPTLIHPSVMAHIGSTETPFSHSTVCDVPVPNYTRGEPDSGISNFSYPSSEYRVIGIYQGGGRWNCGVFRPTGMCRMRSYQYKSDEGNVRRTKFCFVCQYALVNELDPAQHGKLDTREYPG